MTIIGLRRETVEQVVVVVQAFARVAATATAVPASVWRQAHAVVITNQFKGAFIFGVKAGFGVVLVKQPNGHWSVPVLLSANEVSLGLQLGGKAVETVYIITDDATQNHPSRPL